ncbi:eppin-like [Sminthopsis crassicaudata]|uniref:eppin-like n=1 Tax=Sminthopsis crassicaudata TaxID=9301 RepID=UPI003D69DE89
MDARRCFLILMLLMILSQDHNRLLAFLRFKRGRACPRIKEKCLFKESSACFRDKDCKATERCCSFSCRMQCINSSEDPCEEAVNVKPCSNILTRWYFNAENNTCHPFKLNWCNEGKNDFQSHDVCKNTCLAYGHGVTINRFDVEGESITVKT